MKSSTKLTRFHQALQLPANQHFTAGKNTQQKVCRQVKEAQRYHGAGTRQSESTAALQTPAGKSCLSPRRLRAPPPPAVPLGFPQGAEPGALPFNPGCRGYNTHCIFSPAKAPSGRVLQLLRFISCNSRLPSARQQGNTLLLWMGFIPVTSPCPSPCYAQDTRAELPGIQLQGSPWQGCPCTLQRSREQSCGMLAASGQRPELRSASTSPQATMPSWGKPPGKLQAGKAACTSMHGQLHKSWVLSASLTPLVLNAI